MTDRASFLAAIAATPRGSDPGLPEIERAPDAPTELRAGEDRLERFVSEAENVGCVVTRVARDRVAPAALEAVRAAGAERVALADDLGPLGPPIMQALQEHGVEAVDYAQAAADRPALAQLDATLTGCLAAVAATGSIVTSARAGRAAALIAPTHICVVLAEQIVDGLHALLGMDVLDEAGSAFALQSGPSRSADIEKTLILGVHGPGRVQILLVD